MNSKPFLFIPVTAINLPNDLTDERYAYIYGLLMADGNLYLNKGRGTVSLTLNMRDNDIIYKINGVIPSSVKKYSRDTNFKHQDIICWSNHRKYFRDWLMSFGFPYKNKTYDAAVPNCAYNEKGFWRGMIDGDGSIGLKRTGEPFISLVMPGKAMCEAYLDFVEKILGSRPVANLNKNNVYNVVIGCSKAKILSEYLYSNSSIYLDRKHHEYTKISLWQKKNNIKYSKWTKYEDGYIQNNVIEDSISELNRSVYAINRRLWMIRTGKVN